MAEDLKKQLEECEKKAEEYLAGWQRARADLLNYKKEEMERIAELVGYANQELILKILPILDNFEIIEKKLPEVLKKDENVKGLLLMKNQILDFLKSQGVEEIKAVGERFDPNFHEVVEEVEEKGKEPGIILEEIQKGYKVNNKLLRASMVKIAKFCIFTSVIIGSVSNYSPGLCDKKCRETYLERPHISENYYHNSGEREVISSLSSTASGTPVSIKFRTAKTLVLNENIIIDIN